MAKSIEFKVLAEYINGECGNGSTIITTEKDFNEYKKYHKVSNSLVPLTVKCGCGICFEVNFLRFKNDKKRQCNNCASKSRAQKKKNSIEEIIKFVDENGNGCELLSTEYKNNREKLKFKCACGNEFYKNWDNFYSRNIRMCPSCTLKNRKKTMWNLESVNEFVNCNSDSKLISTEYITRKEKLDFMCKCGNVFSATLNNFINANQRQCKICSKIQTIKKQKYTIAEINDVLLQTKTGCVCVSDSYKSCKDHLEFKCSCGNHFTTSWDIVNRSGQNYCWECKSKFLNEATKLPYADVKKRVSNFGFKLLSKEYTNNSSYLKLKCDKGHIFHKSLSNLERNSACSFCTGSVNEKRISKYLDDSSANYKTEYSFSDLISDKGKLLRYDFAIFKNDILTHLIEYDGEFHFMEISISVDGMELLKYHDRLKNEYCLKHNITLVRIPYWDRDSIEEILNDILINNNMESNYIVRQINHDYGTKEAS